MLCDDKSVIGAPFFVMEQAMEWSFATVCPNDSGAGRMRSPTVSFQKWSSTRSVSSIAVDPASCGLDDLGHPDGFLERQVTGWMERWHGARHEDNPIADQVGEWVARKNPVSQATTLSHNDWRLDDMAVDFDDPGRCVAVYDGTCALGETRSPTSGPCCRFGTQPTKYPPR